EVVHPNQAEITLTGEHGRVVEFTAISTGGGMFEVISYQGFSVSLKGDSYDLLLIGGAGLRGEAQACVQALQMCEVTESSVNSGKQVLVQLKFDREPLPELVQRLRALPTLTELVELGPVLPVVKRRDAQVPFCTAE